MGPGIETYRPSRGRGRLPWLGGCLALTVLGPLVASGAEAASFQGLGDLEGGAFRSEAKGVSDSCGSVVGESESALGTEAFVWLAATNAMRALPGADATTTTRATDASAHGAVYVGSRTRDGVTAAVRWTLGSSFVTTTHPPGLRWNATNDDGSVLVGTAGSVAHYLASGLTGVSSLGDLPGGGTASSGFGVSGDGATIVGQGSSANGSEAFRWTDAEGMVGLGDLAGGAFWSTAFSASADGSVIVGSSAAAEGTRAFRWTAGSGMQPLGPLPAGTFSSVARDVSGDGHRVVGIVSIEGVGTRAMIWEAGGPVMRLDRVLEDVGVDLTGWALVDATSISSNGLCAVGIGVNPVGQTEAWLAELPLIVAVPALPPGAVPGVALLVILGATAAAIRRTSKTIPRRTGALAE